MGCGVSKSSIDSDGEAAVSSSKFPPLLRRRFEEIKRRRKTTAKGTLSVKVLLEESYLDDLSASHSGHGDDNGRKSLSSAEGSLRAAKVIPEPEPFDDHKDNDKGEKEADKPAMEEKTEEQNEGEIEDEGEVEDRLSSVGYNEYLCPSSPSFRVYIEPLNDDEDDKSKSEEASQISQADDSGENVESVASNEESAEMKRKEHKRRSKGFRRVMGKGKSGAVKNLLNAASCYNPSISRHDKARPLAEKAGA